MSFIAKCPACGAQLVAPDSVRGKKVRCNKCDERFLAEPAADEDAPPARPARSSRGGGRSRRDADDEDEAPRRKKAASRRPADEDDEDHDEAPARKSRDEDEEEPAAKERKKRKRRRRAIPVPALLGFGSIGLVVLALVIYFAFGREKPPEPGPPVELPVLTPSVMPDPTGGPGVKSTAAPPPPPTVKLDINWVEFTAPDASFTARFPKEPAHSSPMVETPTGRVKTDLFAVEDPKYIALVSAAPIPGAEPGQEVPQPLADKALEAACDAILKRLPGAKEEGRTKITHQGNPGRAVVMAAPDGFGGTARVLIANGRVYTLLFATKGGKPDAATLSSFFDGFNIQS